MTNSREGGFAPLIVVAVFAVLAIGGGVYYANKSSNIDSEANTEVNTDVEASGEIALGVNTNGTLRSLLNVGQDVSCTFTSTAGGYESEGEVFVTAEGDLRSNFTSTSEADAKSESHVIIDGETAYAWSGNTGAELSLSQLNAAATVSSNTKINLDSQIAYECESWDVEESKFSLPSGVNFVDLNAVIDSKLQGVDVKSVIEGSVQ